MEFGVLGSVEVRRDGRLLAVGSGRERFVLAMLLLDADRVVTADWLVDRMWSTPPSSARAQLHNMVSGLRRRLGAGLIETRSPGYQLRLDTHRFDLLRFRGLTRQARLVAEQGDHRLAAWLWSNAVAMRRGPALADVPDQLVGGLRDLLHDEWASAAEGWLAAELALGRHDIVLRELPGLVREFPYRERLHEMEMLALAGAGRRADALAAYQRVRRQLDRDLGIQPGGKLRDLEYQILRSMR